MPQSSFNRYRSQPCLRQSGFTFVELLIVVVIVGVLAAVAIPLYREATIKAYFSEADQAFGTIRTAIRRYEVNTLNQSFAALDAKYDRVRVADMTELDLKPTDLDGAFFDSNSYYIVFKSPSYYMQAVPDSSRTGKVDHLTGLVRMMWADGTFGTWDSQQGKWHSAW